MDKITQQHLEAIESECIHMTYSDEHNAESKAAEKCAEITEQVAIGFAIWVNYKCYVYDSNDEWYLDDIKFTSKEIIELYKTQTR